MGKLSHISICLRLLGSRKVSQLIANVVLLKSFSATSHILPSNPIILISLFVEGEPAEFAIELGDGGSLLMPIDDASWDESFQEGGELGSSGDSEDTPGFTLVVASAAIAMAAFINTRKEETEE